MLFGDVGSRLRPATVDSFEDFDLSEYAGDTGSWDINDRLVAEGVYGVELHDESSGFQQDMHSTAGLDRYPDIGDRLTYWFAANRAADSNLTTLNVGAGFAVGEADAGNKYAILHYYSRNDGSISIYRADGYDYTLLAGTNPMNYAADTPYESVVEWDDGDSFGGVAGDINVTVYDTSGTAVGSVSANDTTYDDGGMVVEGAHDSTAYRSAIDYYHLGRDTEVSPTWTQPATVMIDDFEDADMSEYQTSDSAAVQTQTSVVNSGSYGAIIPGGNFNTDWTLSDNGLGAYPAAGDRFRYYITRNGNEASDRIWLAWCVQDIPPNSEPFPDAYAIEHEGDEWYIDKWVGGSTYTLASGSYAPPADTTFHYVDVDHGSDGTITATAYDLTDTQQSQIQASDTDYSTGGFGYVTGADMAYDWYLDDIELL